MVLTFLKLLFLAKNMQPDCSLSILAILAQLPGAQSKVAVETKFRRNFMHSI